MSFDAAADVGTVRPPPDAGIVWTGSDPPDGVVDVARSSWVRLKFSGPAPDALVASVRLDCGEGTPAADVTAAGDTVVLNPRAFLPPLARCAVAFELPSGAERLEFAVAAEGVPAIIPYDRADTRALTPFPDDYYLIPEGAARGGLRVDVPVPSVASLAPLFTAAIDATRQLDGQSPLAPIVVALPDALARDTIPLTARASIDPFASVGLFDVDPASEERGRRVPFDALLRDEVDAGGGISHTLIVFPSIPLRPRGRYAFVVTGRALVSPSRPLQPSSFFENVALGRASTEEEKRLEPIVASLLSELSQTNPPLLADDLALGLSITVRSLDGIANDLLSIREGTAAAPAPTYTIDSVTAEPDGHIAAIVQGTWWPVSWTDDHKFVRRDGAGKPVPGPTEPVPFTLAIPRRAAGAAPIVIHQALQPGSSEEEVPASAQAYLAEAGFAVIGFADITQRFIAPDGKDETLNRDIFMSLLTRHRLPDYMSLLANAEQLAFLRLISSLGSLDVLPIGAPDGEPDLDPRQPLGFVGVNQGAVAGASLVAVAPEIRSAALISGGGRFSAPLVHSAADTVYGQIAVLFPELTRTEFYAGVSLVQMGYDNQDAMNLARAEWRQPLASAPSERASILVSEGVGDPYFPAYAVRSMAWTLGLPQLVPNAEDVPFLPRVTGPVRGNLGSSATGAFVQFVPSGSLTGGPTPSCYRPRETNANRCARRAQEGAVQRAAFFTSALSGTPIIDYAR